MTTQANTAIALVATAPAQKPAPAPMRADMEGLYPEIGAAIFAAAQAQNAALATIKLIRLTGGKDAREKKQAAIERTIKIYWIMAGLAKKGHVGDGDMALLRKEALRLDALKGWRKGITQTDEYRTAAEQKLFDAARAALTYYRKALGWESIDKRGGARINAGAKGATTDNVAHIETKEPAAATAPAPQAPSAVTPAIPAVNDTKEAAKRAYRKSTPK
jgi:hypothetical protein